MSCIIKQNFDFSLIRYFDSQIRDEDVSLRVNSEFQHSYLGEPLDVEFSYNRLEREIEFHFTNLFIFPLEIMHHSSYKSV